MSGFLESNFATVLGLGIPAASVAFYLYQRTKSNSSASIINKIWSLLYGEKEYYNPKINSFSKNQHDVDKFNLAYGFRFNNVDEIERFLTWIDDKKYQIHWFSNLGKHFRIKDFTLVSLSAKYRIKTGVFSLFCLVFGLSFGEKIYSDLLISKPNIIQIFVPCMLTLELLIVALIIGLRFIAAMKAFRTHKKLDILAESKKPS